MHYAIRHRTVYEFEPAVHLEPHVLRFRPRSDPSQQAEGFTLAVSPQPAGLSAGIDLSSNAFTVAWFDGTTKKLVIDATARVTTTRANPFDYLILPGGLDPLPWTVPDPAAVPFLLRETGAGEDPVARFAGKIARSTDTVVPFLGALQDSIYSTAKVYIRDEGDPNPVSETLATRTGSCRDLAVLFIDCCRAQGIPARFVSGYQEGDPAQDRRDLHAWAEAWIPGAGWRGYDPTLGLVVADRHIPVAAAAHPSDAAPVRGTFRGKPESVAMSYEIEIDVLA
jgi:transglutaminase-like putative cysteine protease